MSLRTTATFTRVRVAVLTPNEVRLQFSLHELLR
jgi:hypothetical protein